MNYFEEMGIQWAFGWIPYTLIATYMDSVVISYWKLLQPIVEYLRRRDESPRVYVNFEQLATSLYEKR
jgi:hypothetical protein